MTVRATRGGHVGIEGRWTDQYQPRWCVGPKLPYLCLFVGLRPAFNGLDTTEEKDGPEITATRFFMSDDLTDWVMDKETGRVGKW